jgi:hypothetical protein
MNPELEETPLLFRFHRGSLDESMKTVVEIKSESQLKKVIEGGFEPTVIDLYITPYCFDERNGWDTHMVRVIMNHEPDALYPIGFLNKAPGWLYEKTARIPD